ncbi:unnamed protein product [Dicrocoelium dendriticum]|nr:unnamed protein product [Dicrocoelium dendriticum]
MRMLWTTLSRYNFPPVLLFPGDIRANSATKAVSGFPSDEFGVSTNSYLSC